MRDAQFERDVIAICEIGPRPVLELLREIGADTLQMTRIESLVARYATLDPVALRALGGDYFPPRVLREVPK